MIAKFEENFYDFFQNLPNSVKIIKNMTKGKSMFSISYCNLRRLLSPEVLIAAPVAVGLNYQFKSLLF
jgi:hypothetical protein